jgi:hypothetical protein
LGLPDRGGGEDARKQRLERLPVEPLLSGPEILQPSHTRSPSRQQTKLGKGHGATSANHPLWANPQNQIRPTSAKLFGCGADETKFPRFAKDRLTPYKGVIPSLGASEPTCHDLPDVPHRTRLRSPGNR